jgi:serralysin
MEFSFPTSNASKETGGGGTDWAAELSEAGKACARACFAFVSEITGVIFFEGPHNSTTSNFRICRKAGTGSFADSPHPVASGVYLSASGDGGAQPGNFSWRTIWHEIGHALGLKHPHQLGLATVDPAIDCQSVSLMSYRNVVGGSTSSSNPSANQIINWPQSYMRLDINALRWIYGTGEAPVNPVYTWSPTTGEAFRDGVAVRPVPVTNHVFECLPWDGECDLTAQTSPNVSDLTAIITDSGQLANLGGGNIAVANVFTAEGVDVTAET